MDNKDVIQRRKTEFISIINNTLYLWEYKITSAPTVIIHYSYIQLLREIKCLEKESQCGQWILTKQILRHIKALIC